MPLRCAAQIPIAAPVSVVLLTPFDGNCGLLPATMIPEDVTVPVSASKAYCDGSKL